jgi:hypothetical protein
MSVEDIMMRICKECNFGLQYFTLYGICTRFVDVISNVIVFAQNTRFAHNYSCAKLFAQKPMYERYVRYAACTT